jgi:N6-L-threonylcarbamoyladenine synthase
VRAAERALVSTVVVAGGVAANRALRERIEEACAAKSWAFAAPELKYCGDNGAMVGLAGAMRLARGESSAWDLSAVPTLLQTSFGD